MNNKQHPLTKSLKTDEAYSLISDIAFVADALKDHHKEMSTREEDDCMTTYYVTSVDAHIAQLENLTRLLRKQIAPQNL